MDTLEALVKEAADEAMHATSGSAGSVALRLLARALPLLRADPVVLHLLRELADAEDDLRECEKELHEEANIVRSQRKELEELSLFAQHEKQCAQKAFDDVSKSAHEIVKEERAARKVAEAALAAERNALDHLRGSTKEASETLTSLGWSWSGEDPYACEWRQPADGTGETKWRTTFDALHVALMLERTARLATDSELEDVREAAKVPERSSRPLWRR